MLLITALYFIVDKLEWGGMWNSEEENVTIENYLAWKILSYKYLKWSICLLLTVAWLFVLVFPSVWKSISSRSFPPLGDSWWSYLLLAFSLCWTGGCTERLQKPLQAFEQILIISGVLKLKVSQVWGPQRVLLEVLFQVELRTTYLHAAERWTWLPGVSPQPAQ